MILCCVIAYNIFIIWYVIYRVAIVGMGTTWKETLIIFISFICLGNFVFGAILYILIKLL